MQRSHSLSKRTRVKAQNKVHGLEMLSFLRKPCFDLGGWNQATSKLTALRREERGTFSPGRRFFLFSLYRTGGNLTTNSQASTIRSQPWQPQTRPYHSHQVHQVHHPEAKHQIELEGHRQVEAEVVETPEVEAEVEEEEEGDPTMTNTATGHVQPQPSLTAIFLPFYLVRHH